MEWTDLGRDPVRDPEALGRRPGGGAWPTEVKRWWAMWQRSPMASQFLETDWSHLRMTALMFQDYIEAPTPSKFKAVIAAEERLGSTIAARVQLRLRPQTRGPVVAEEDGPRLRAVPEQDPRQALVGKGG